MGFGLTDPASVHHDLNTSVAAHETVRVDPPLRYTLHVAGAISNQDTTESSVSPAKQWCYGEAKRFLACT